MYVSLVSIKCFRRSCRLRKVWYDTNECLAATLDGQLFVTRVTRRVVLMDQELLSHPKHPRWPPVFSGVCVARSLVFMCCFVDRWLSLVLFLFAIVLFVLLRFTGFGYTFSIFKLVLCFVLDDSFFHSLFLLYHSKRTPSFFQCNHLPLYFIICQFVLVMIIATWLLMYR